MKTRKITHLLLLALMLVCGSQWAMAQKLGMFIGYNDISAIEDDDEKAAAEWFNTNYVAKGEGQFFTPANINTLNAMNVRALWVAIDRVGIEKGYNNLPAAFNSNEAITAMKKFVQDGGNLLLTSHATQLIVPLERVTDVYAPNLFGSAAGGDNPDVWGINAQIGATQANPYDHRLHAIYQGLEANTTQYSDHEFFPLIGAGCKEDHNCKWDFNAIAGLENNPNKLADFEQKTSSTVLGAWQHVVDYACAGVIEFHPTTGFKGTILCNGIAAYEWNQNNVTNAYQSNIEKLTANSLEYLKSLNTLTIADNANNVAEAISTMSGKPIDFILTRQLKADTWNTICLPFDVNADQINSVLKSAGYVKTFDREEASTQTIYFKDAETMQAGVPYLIKPTEEVATLTFDGVTITSTEAKSNGTECGIHGTYAPYTMNTDGTEMFLNANRQFVVPAVGKNEMKGFRAYFFKPSSISAAAFNINFGEATAINGVKTEANNEQNMKVYNLNGQYVGTNLNALPKGLYIVGGKKVLK